MNKLSKGILAAGISLVASISAINIDAHAMTQKDLGGKTYLVETVGSNGQSQNEDGRRIAVTFNPQGTRYTSFVVKTDGNGNIGDVILSKSDFTKAQKGGKSLQKVSTKVGEVGYKVKHGKKKDLISLPEVDKMVKVQGDANGFSAKYNQDGATKTKVFKVANNPYQFNWE